MADFGAEAQAIAGGHELDWTLHFDDSANTVTVNAEHKRTDGQPAVGMPQEASITITLNGGFEVTLDLLTGRLDSGAAFEQGNPGNMINAGPRVRSNVRVRVSANRAALLEFTTQYRPPVS